MNLQNRKRLTDLENELMVARRKDSQRLWEGHVHTAIFKMDKQQRPIVQHMELAQYQVPDWMRGRFGGEWIHVYVQLSPFAVLPETATTLLIGYTSTQNSLKFF